MKTYRVAGINFDHMHMGDLLRLVHAHPWAEIVGICDEQPERMQSAATNFDLPSERIFTDYRECLDRTKPDLVILCPATSEHAAWTERVAPFGCHVLVEKPFASTLAEADRMSAALATTGKQLVINWPLRWYPPHVTAKRLLDEGRIGDLLEVHYYDGNRGPLAHAEDKIELKPTPERKAASWFYRKASGGGSLLDYLGYGVTLGTWYHNGRKPIEVTTITHHADEDEVDEHSVTIARYASGLSKFETRWGTFTDPWRNQPQPKCGFVCVGTQGTIASYDYEPVIHLQTLKQKSIHQLPVDTLAGEEADPIAYVLPRLEDGRAIEGPLSPAVCRIGQQIVDTAVLSAERKQTMPLVEK